METTFILNLSYLIGVLTFVFGLRLLGSPDTARKGNMLAAFGMTFAVLVTLLIPMADAPNNYLWIFGGLMIGGLIGWRTAIKVKLPEYEHKSGRRAKKWSNKGKCRLVIPTAWGLSRHKVITLNCLHFQRESPLGEFAPHALCIQP